MNWLLQILETSENYCINLKCEDSVYGHRKTDITLEDLEHEIIKLLNTNMSLSDKLFIYVDKKMDIIDDMKNLSKRNYKLRIVS